MAALCSRWRARPHHRDPGEEAAALRRFRSGYSKNSRADGRQSCESSQERHLIDKELAAFAVRRSNAGDSRRWASWRRCRPRICGAAGAAGAALAGDRARRGHAAAGADAAEERFESSLELEWPIEGLEPLSFVLTRLLEPLSTRLERRDRGAAVLHVLLRLVTRDLSRAAARAAVADARRAHAADAGAARSRIAPAGRRRSIASPS